MKYTLCHLLLTSLFALSVAASSNAAQDSKVVMQSATQASLASIIAARSDEDKSRDLYRNPQQVLEFSGIQPGMTVIEVLPGGGWYTKILAPYLQAEGTLHSAHYPRDVWEMFGFFDADTIDKRVEAVKSWPVTVNQYGGDGSHSVGFAFGAMPKSLKGTVDAVFMVRALHNLNRFEEEVGIRRQALKEIYEALKPGGSVTLVQHRAPEAASDDWAEGQNGYLKKSAVIAMFAEVGMQLADESEVNANPKDQPKADDFVWRLPPSLMTSQDNPELQAQLKAIGESDRMTLKFIKK